MPISHARHLSSERKLHTYVCSSQSNIRSALGFIILLYPCFFIHARVLLLLSVAASLPSALPISPLAGVTPSANYSVIECEEEEEAESHRLNYHSRSVFCVRPLVANSHCLSYIHTRTHHGQKANDTSTHCSSRLSTTVLHADALRISWLFFYLYSLLFFFVTRCSYVLPSCEKFSSSRSVRKILIDSVEKFIALRGNM